jgi:uroporphyrinogen-III synthase
VQQKTVAILEARLGRQLAELVARKGGRPFPAPALAEVPDVDRERIVRLLAELEERPPALAIFQTGVGTSALFRATDELALTPRLLALLERTRVLVRGPKPTAVLRQRGVRIDASAAEPFTTEQVLAALGDTELRGQRVLVQRYGGANPELERALAARGAQWIEIPTYRWALPQDTGPLVALFDALERGEIDAVAVTNAAQVHNLFGLAHRLGRTESLRAGLNRTLVASIGPVSTRALREHGVAVGIEASPPKLGPLVAALEEALGRGAGC